MHFRRADGYATSSALIAVAAGFLGTIVAASPAFSQVNPERNVYFGEQHVHTSWSFDAFAFGDTVTAGSWSAAHEPLEQ